jgi:DNA primase
LEFAPLQDVINEIKNRIKPEELFAEYGYPFTLQGGSWRRCCIFHEEDTPSLSIKAGEDYYKCFGVGCGASGDVFDIVQHLENVGFVEAIQILAEKCDLSYSLFSEEEKEEYSNHEIVRKILNECISTWHQNLIDDEEMISFVEEQWGINSDSIKKYKLGLCNGDTKKKIKKFIKENEITKDHLEWSGLFNGKSTYDKFDGRIIFPVFNGRQAKNLHARVSPKTPVDKYNYKTDEAGNVLEDKPIKYKFLKDSDYIENKFFFNEASFHATESVLIVEGPTDCILAEQNGNIPAVAVGGTHGSPKKLKRLENIVGRIKEIFICFDKDENLAGQKATMKMAYFFSEIGKSCRLVNLPLPDGIKSVDICDFFKMGHSSVDFHDLIENADSYLDALIESIPTDIQRASLSDAINPILKRIKNFDAITQDAYVDKIARRFNINKRTLKKTLEDVVSVEEETSYLVRQTDLTEIINRKRLGTRIPEDHMAEVIFEWFRNHDGEFWVDQRGDVRLCYRDLIYKMSDNPPFNALMKQVANINPMSSEGRYIYKDLESMAYINGKKIKDASWIHTDLERCSIIISLYNDRGEILEIEPNAITRMKNGLNKYNVLLRESRQILPIKFDPNISIDEGMNLLIEKFFRFLPMSFEDKMMLTSWLLSCFLVDFVSSRPILRLEGPSAAGKSAAARLCTILIYGTSALKYGTEAAHWESGQDVPVSIEDNLETSGLTGGKSQFLKLASTATSRQKIDFHSQDNLREQSVNGLIMLTGIEAFTESELINRMLIARVGAQYKHSEYSEVYTPKELQDARDKILSSFYKLLSEKILPEMNDKTFEDIRKWIQGNFAHAKSRSNAFISIMSIICSHLLDYVEAPSKIIIRKDDSTRINMDEIDDTTSKLLINWIQGQKYREERVQQESSVWLYFIEEIYNEYKIYLEEANGREQFYKDYGLQPDYAGSRFSIDCTSAQLFRSFTSLAKKINQKRPFESAAQMSSRLRNDYGILQRAGWGREKVKTVQGTKVYRFTKYLGREG